MFDCNHEICNIEEKAEEFAMKHNMIKIKRIGLLDAYLFKINPSIRDSFDIQALRNEEDVIYSERQVLLQRSKRIEFTDPLFKDQWHLNNDANLTHINVEGAWELGYTGEGVVLAVVDDGIETTHGDIKDNFIQNASYNFNFDNNNVSPRSSIDYHGTSVAGCAAARDDGEICGVGVAYRSSISGIVLLQGPITDAIEAAALQHRIDINDIYSNSWGPTDNAQNLVGPGFLAKMALEKGIREGRNGKGSIYVWAAGNGGIKGDNCNYDGYASWRKSMTISSVSPTGTTPSFAENCSSILAVTPSTGIRTSRINNVCTNTFSGTSASAPIGAGVIALILQANPNLNWLDVQRVIVETSVKVDENHADWVQNGAGYWVSHRYGYGLLDATRAVNRAIELKDEPSMTEVSVIYQVNVNSNFLGSDEYVVNILQTFVIHHVEVEINLLHPKSGDLQIELISPSGTKSVLAEFHADMHSNIQWTYTTKLLWGETSYGEWKLKITEKQNQGGTMKSFKLKMYGTPNVEVDTDKNFVIDLRKGNPLPVPAPEPKESGGYRM